MDLLEVSMIGTGQLLRRFAMSCAIASLTAAWLAHPCRGVGPMHGDGYTRHDLVAESAIGVDVPTDDGEVVFVPTNRIPLVPGVSFGWNLTLANPAEAVWLREELTLPAAPSSWGIGDDTSISDDGRVAVTERLVPVDDGRVWSRWVVTPGDPAGPYRLRVFVDGTLVRVFSVDADDPRAPTD